MLLAILCRQFERIVAYLQVKPRWIAGSLRRPRTASIQIREEPGSKCLMDQCTNRGSPPCNHQMLDYEFHQRFRTPRFQ
jgi:hypothetical protein